MQVRNFAMKQRNMKNSDKRVLEMKAMLEEEHGREFSLEEAQSAHNKFEALSEIAHTLATEEMKRRRLLAESPDGYMTKGNGVCQICRNPISNKDSWYDKFGFKCLICQEAIKNKVIPNSVAVDKESWYSKEELKSYFNFNSRDLIKFAKNQILKSRIIYNNEDRIHLQLFLMKDNKGMLPPKKLLKSRTVHTVENDKHYLRLEMWYEFLDEKLAKQLRKYPILQYLETSFARPIESYQMVFNEISPLFRIQE